MLNRLKVVGKKTLIYTLSLAGILSWNIFLAARDTLSEEEVAIVESFQAQVQVQEQLAMDGQLGTGSVSTNKVPTVQASYGVVMEDSLNVRTGPGTDYPVAGLVNRNDEVRLLEDLATGWWKIDFGGRTCYVSAEFIAPLSYSGME